MRLRILSLLFALLVVAFGAAVSEAFSQTTDAQPQRAIAWDDGWLFSDTNPADAEQPATSDADWQRLDLPHDWSIAGPFAKENPANGEGGFLPTGVCWYRKHFSLPAAASGRRVFVEFDGVMANSDVWVNGVSLGHRPNGYVSFSYDITDHVQFGEDKQNLLAVRADTSAQVASRWYTGTGIYRHVRLVTVDPLHFDYSGVYVTTPRIEPNQAEVRVQATVRNQHPEARAVALQVEILSPAHAPVAQVSEQASIAAGQSQDVAATLTVPDPQLWDTEQPHLYTAVTRLVVAGQVVDEVITPFGIRTAEFRSDTGFWLNDRNLKLKGVCLHHDGGAVGAAVPLGVWRYRLEQLRSLGVNAIRTAHNPVAPEFLDLCDQMGMLVMDEFFDCWQVGKRRHDYHLYFNEWSERDLVDTLRRDRNHPSIILYSVGNEIHDTPRTEQAQRILRGLVDACHATDPTRPVTQALFRPNVSHDYDNGLADMLDVIGTNYRDAELLQAWRDKPTRKIVGTEQGHDRSIWLACRDNPQHSGQFLWVGIDYLGESRSWPVTTFDAGLLDRTGSPHPRGYERQSWWGTQPMVRVFRRVAQTEATPSDPGYEVDEWKRRQVLFSDWTPRAMTPHDEQVEVYSNCQEVELFLNGQSLGHQPLPKDARPRTWQVGYQPGTLLAVARNDSKEVARHELRTAGPPHHIALTANHESLGSSWDDVAILTATIVDKYGVFVPSAEPELIFAVAGPGRVIAVDNGSITSHEPFQASKRRAGQGRCIAIVRATAPTGTISLTAESEGLGSGRVELQIQSE